MNSLKVPLGFTSLADAPVAGLNVTHNIIGMVVAAHEPTPTRDPSRMMMTFNLIDTTVYNSMDLIEGVMVRFFVHREGCDLPPLAIGDIVRLMKVRWTSAMGKRMFTNSNAYMDWVVFKRESIPDPSFKMANLGGRQLPTVQSRKVGPQVIKPAENDYVIELKAKHKLFAEYHKSLKEVGVRSVAGQKRAASITDLNLHAAKVGKSSKPVRALICTVEAEHYYHLTVEVLKSFDRGAEQELLVTDYTTNPLLSNYPAPEDGGHGSITGPGGKEKYLEKGWTGPYGRQVLRLVAKGAHGEWARGKVVVGDIYDLWNVKITRDMLDSLEGTMWPDQKDYGRVCIARPLTHEHVSALEARKNEYLTARRKITGQPNALSALNGSGQDPDQQSKSARDRARKKANKRVKEQAQKVHERSNKNVRCSFPDVPLSSVADIQDEENKHHTYHLDVGEVLLPFVNLNFRAKVSVVDFRPDIEDFAHLELEVPPDSQDSYGRMLPTDPVPVWKWSFQLQLKDSIGELLVVDVGHKQAQFLLGDLEDAADLKSSPHLLHKLKDRLFTLWGNLEELKSAGKDLGAVSNTEFECCISEYGVCDDDGNPDDINDYKRRFMLHGTCII